jgi:hypothetical protein
MSEIIVRLRQDIADDPSARAVVAALVAAAGEGPGRVLRTAAVSRAAELIAEYMLDGGRLEDIPPVALRVFAAMISRDPLGLQAEIFEALAAVHSTPS